MRARGYNRRREGELTYWYRAAAPLPDGARAPEPLVFIHGVGFGPAPYAPFLRPPRAAPINAPRSAHASRGACVAGQGWEGWELTHILAV